MIIDISVQNISASIKDSEGNVIMSGKATDYAFKGDFNALITEFTKLVQTAASAKSTIDSLV